MLYNTLFIALLLSAVYPITINAQEVLFCNGNPLRSADLQSLQQHIKRALKYPAVAQDLGVRGFVYIQFHLDKSGAVVKESVKVIKSLHPSCDLEAIKAIQSYDSIWTTVEGITLKPFIIPIFFNKDHVVLEFPSHFLTAPMKTAVVSKAVKTADANWSIYAGKGLSNPIDKISPGDSVSVIGWAAWSYLIETKNVVGYVSFHALHVTEQMKVVAEIVEQRSPDEEKIEDAQREYERKVLRKTLDTVRNFSIETAHLSLSISKKDVYVGECTTVTLSFNVRNDNKLPIRFHELGPQLSEILSTSLYPTHAFILSNHIVDIKGTDVTIANQNYVTYKIFQASYCPSEYKPVLFPSIKLLMLIMKPNLKEEEKIAEFRTPITTINVKPIPNLREKNQLLIVGDLKLEETLQDTVQVGKPFVYQIKVKGNGLTSIIEPPRIKDPLLQMTLMKIDSHDTIINDVLSSEKMFSYELVAKKKGRFTLRDSIQFAFFNPQTGKKQKIKSTSAFYAKPALDSTKGSVSGNNAFFTQNNFIVIDGSQSMMIEDYDPNRFGAVKQGVLQFLQKKNKCSFGLIVFGDKAQHIVPDGELSCYTQDQINSLQLAENGGTAIGDAIWYASISMRGGEEIKRVVVIGDGDNTSGAINPVYAAAFAKKKHIQIFTIGIGNKGIVPYGRDAFGRQYMIENTFSDKDFKEIAHSTGGRYYHASNASEIEEILSQIFK